MSDAINSRIDAGVLELGFARPEKKNALTRAMYATLAEQLRESVERDEVGAVLFYGSGDAFTAGNDLRDFLDDPPLDEQSPVFAFLDALANCPLPVVAAVNGLAIGIGTTLLLHCDLVYAGDDATFRLPFVDLGLVPEAASSLLLPRMAGHARAAELLLLGEPFDAGRAQAFGLLNRVVASTDVIDTARDAARRLADKPRTAVRVTKALLKREAEPVAARMQAEAAHFAERLQSPEARAAFRAFLGDDG